MLDRFERDDPDYRLLEKLNKLVAAVNRLENLQGGPGVTIKRGSGGMTIFVERPQVRASVPSAGEPATGIINDTKVLGRLQGTRDTDSWTRGEDNPARSVQYYVVTDPKYDPSTLQFTVRMRPVIADTAGCTYQVGAEDEDLTLIFTAVLCQPNP